MVRISHYIWSSIKIGSMRSINKIEPQFRVIVKKIGRFPSVDTTADKASWVILLLQT